MVSLRVHIPNPERTSGGGGGNEGPRESSLCLQLINLLAVTAVDHKSLSTNGLVTLLGRTTHTFCTPTAPQTCSIVHPVHNGARSLCITNLALASGAQRCTTIVHHHRGGISVEQVSGEKRKGLARNLQSAGSKLRFGLCEDLVCGVVWCGVVWCGVPKALLPKGKGRDVYPRVQVNGLGCVCCVRAVCKCVVA